MMINGLPADAVKRYNDALFNVTSLDVNLEIGEIFGSMELAMAADKDLFDQLKALVEEFTQRGYLVTYERKTKQGVDEDDFIRVGHKLPKPVRKLMKEHADHHNEKFKKDFENLLNSLMNKGNISDGQDEGDED